MRFTARNGDALRIWREEYARYMLKLDFEPCSDAPFHASIEPVIAGLRVARSALSPGFTVRDKELIKDSDDSFALIIAQSRRLEVKKCREFSLGRGDGALMRIDDPGLLGATESFAYIAMMIPAAELKEREPATNAVILQRLPRRSEPLQLLRAYLRALAQGPDLRTDQMMETIRGHLFDLIAMAAAPQGHLGESDLAAVAAARLSAAIEHIETHFADSSLGAEAVARAQGVSTRYINKLFESAGLSLKGHLRDIRLREAYRRLGDQQCSGLTISQIAHACGFSDLSHFNRLFRLRYSESPSGVRSQRLRN